MDISSNATWVYWAVQQQSGYCKPAEIIFDKECQWISVSKGKREKIVCAFIVEWLILSK